MSLPAIFFKTIPYKIAFIIFAVYLLVVGSLTFAALQYKQATVEELAPKTNRPAESTAASQPQQTSPTKTPASSTIAPPN